MSSVRVQFGALPYRISDERGLEILLITSRRRGRWIVPKGWPIKGLDAAETALREAYEEAGVVGDIAPKPIGVIQYQKMGANGRFDDDISVDVQIFPLKVHQQLPTWPERGQRRCLWTDPQRASEMVADGDLRLLIALLAHWHAHQSCELPGTDFQYCDHQALSRRS